MTEKEKMMAGKPYLASDKTLVEERNHARELLYRLHSYPPDAGDERQTIFRELFGKLPKDFNIELPFRCDYGYNISAGGNFYANYNCTILDCAPVTIGQNVMLAPNVSIFTAGHPLHFEPRNRQLEYAFPVIIGDNVWIGGNVVINPGVIIGDHTVIGSGSVVTKNIPSMVVAAGNPCRIIRNITAEDRKYYYKNLTL